MQRIVFVERNTFNIDFPRPSFPHEWIEYGETHSDQIVERIADATIAICNKLRLSGDALAKLPKLKMIAVAATGVDNIDLEFCRSRGIAVCNTRGYATTSLPEHVLMLMLALRRNLIAYVADVRRGRWQVSPQFCLLDHSINDLNGATLGIIGYGRVGQAVAKLARAMGMRVLIAEHKHASEIRSGRSPFSEVLYQSDILSLHCPLTPETANLIGREELRRIRPHAILINTARGGLIDDEALVDALKNGRLGGAGIDVLRTEPPREGDPLLNINSSNLIVTPHNAWASRQAMQTLAAQLIENLEAFVKGEPKNLVV